MAECAEKRGQGRRRDKDALDVFRLLQGTETAILAASCRTLASDLLDAIDGT